MNPYQYPVEFVQDNGQVLLGRIDLLLETESGWLVIDHKSSPRPARSGQTRRWNTQVNLLRMREHSAELVWSVQVAVCTSRWVVACEVYFPPPRGEVR